MEQRSETYKMGFRHAERGSISQSLLNDLLMDLAPAKGNAVPVQGEIAGGLGKEDEIELQATKRDSTGSLLSKNCNFVSSSLSSLGSKLKSGIVAKQTRISGGSAHGGGKSSSSSFLYRLSSKATSVSQFEGSTSSLNSSKPSLGTGGLNYYERRIERPLEGTMNHCNSDEVPLKGIVDCAQWAVSLNATGYAIDGNMCTMTDPHAIGIQSTSISKDMNHSLGSLDFTTLKLSEGTTRRSIAGGHSRRTKNVRDSASSTSKFSASLGQRREGASFDRSIESLTSRRESSSSSFLRRSTSPTTQLSRRSGFSGRRGDSASIASVRSFSAGREQRRDGKPDDRSIDSSTRRLSVGSSLSLSRLPSHSTSPTTQPSRRSGFSGRRGDSASISSTRSFSAGRQQRRDGMSGDRSVASLTRRLPAGSSSSLSRLPSRSTSPTTQLSRRSGFSRKRGDPTGIDSYVSASSRRGRRDGMASNGSVAGSCASGRRGESSSSLSRLPSSGVGRKRGGPTRSVNSNFSSTSRRGRREGAPSDRSSSAGSGSRRPRPSSSSRLPRRKGGDGAAVVGTGRHPSTNSKNSLTLSRHQTRCSSNPSLKPLLLLFEEGGKPQPEANQQEGASDALGSVVAASSSADASWGASEDPPTTSMDTLHQSLPDLSKLLGWDEEDADHSEGGNFQAMANASWDFAALTRQSIMSDSSSPNRNNHRRRVAMKSKGGRYSSVMAATTTTTPPLTIVLSDRQKEIMASLIELENDLLEPTEAWS